MSQTIRRVELKGRTIVLAGTAHISQESIDEVKGLIASEKPDRVCVEIDEPRWHSMTQGKSWESLDIGKVLREGRGFLLMANLALAGFQRRMGAEVGVKPGEEMIAAVRAAEEAGIPYSFCDRDVQITLKRAWAKSGFWNRTKLISALLESSFFGEKLKEEEIERLKERNELETMMNELAEYLPSIKEVLIDERDRYLASRIFESPEPLVVAVVGAGHLPGIEAWLAKLDAGSATPDTSEIAVVPPKSFFGKYAGLIVPAIILALIAAGFFLSGPQKSLDLLLRWVIFNGGFAAIGAALCFAHPLTILVSFVAAPFATINPVVGVGLFAGLMEAWLRKPRVSDLESLSEDVTHIKGFYTNRVTHILLVFFVSTLGGALGNFIGIGGLFSGILGK